jgi:tetratricopeptide (TPR) repeat protein
LIFGPYRAIPKGIYCVDFQVELLDVAGDAPTGGLRFDVADSGALLCQRALAFRELKAGVRPVLEFIQERDDALLEFRISGDCCQGGAAQFRGVILAKLGSMAYMLEQGGSGEILRSVRVIEIPRRHRRNWWILLRRVRRAAAAGTFGEADRARDRRDWPNAVRLYGKGLKLDPGNFAMWMQYGHSLKQNNRLAEAEAAYRKAIDLCPEDADANLQIGHLLKIQGRLSEAVVYYTRASELASPAGQYAREELIKCGVSP